MCHSVRLKPRLSWGPDYNNLTLFWQWEEPCSSSNPQSDITSEEHLKISLRFLSTNTFKISCIFHLREYALNVFKQPDAISTCTSRGHQNFRRYCVLLKRAGYNRHVPAHIILVLYPRWSVRSALVPHCRVVTLRKLFWRGTVDRRSRVVSSSVWVSDWVLGKTRNRIW